MWKDSRNPRLCGGCRLTTQSLLHTTLGVDHEVAANEGDTTLVEALYKDVKTYKFISILCILRDVLEPLTKCSKVFQRDVIDVEDTSTMLAATMDSIATLPEHPGTHLSDHDSLDNDHEFQGIRFTATAHQKRETKNLCQRFVTALQQQANQRFPAEDMDTLKSLNKVLNPVALPRAMQEMLHLGHDHIQSLAEALPQIILDRAKGDYRLFKFFLNLNRELDLQQLCTKLIKEKSEDFPDFAILANISLVVPLTLVPCERGFSVQNNIVKTKRSRMNVGNLNNKMLLVSEKRQADLTEDAVREFCNSAKRLKRCWFCVWQCDTVCVGV